MPSIDEREAVLASLAHCCNKLIDKNCVVCRLSTSTAPWKGSLSVRTASSAVSANNTKLIKKLLSSLMAQTLRATCSRPYCSKRCSSSATAVPRGVLAKQFKVNGVVHVALAYNKRAGRAVHRRPAVDHSGVKIMARPERVAPARIVREHQKLPGAVLVSVGRLNDALRARLSRDGVAQGDIIFFGTELRQTVCSDGT